MSLFLIEKMKLYYQKLLMQLLLLAFVQNVVAYTCEVNGIYYDLRDADKTATVTYQRYGASSYSGNVVVPSEIEYKDVVYSVVAIGYNAFHNCKDLNSVSLPATITTIGSSAFSGCSSMAEIGITNSVTTLGSNAFEGTAWLDRQPDGVVYAGKAVYKYKGDMPENTAIALREGTLTIAEEAFMGQQNLSSIDFPSSLISIGRWAFKDCTGISSVFIPKGVRSIGESYDMNVFRGCSGIERIVVEEGNDLYDSRNGCNAIISVKESVFGVGCKNSFIPEDIAEIGSCAFENCIGLTSIKLPDGVRRIGVFAFRGCSDLEEMNIPGSVTDIDDGGFEGCSSLKSLHIPAKLTYIGGGAFEGCSAGLRSITVDENNPQYDSRGGCNALIETNRNFLMLGCRNTMIPETVTDIGGDGFENCTELKSIVIPASVKWMSFRAFAECNNLSTVVSMITEPFVIDDRTFSEQTYQSVLYVPEGTKAKYEATKGWMNFKTIEEGLPSEIGQVKMELYGEIRSFSIDGKAVNHYDGLRIFRMSDGSVRKVMMK